jgi:cell wall-associated NlpC family hydrolase
MYHTYSKHLSYSTCASLLLSLGTHCASTLRTTHRINSPVANLLAQPNIHYTKMAPVSALDVPQLSSQLIYNEPVSLIKTQGNWALVTSPTTQVMIDQHLQPLRGWIEKNQLYPQAPAATTAHTELICTAPLTPIFRKTGHNPHQLAHLFTVPYETRLYGIERESSWWRVSLLDGTTAYVPAPSITLSREVPTNNAQIRTQIVAHARQLLGSPYCWGGTSAYNPSCTDQLTGFDCSGLTERLYKACNILIPRNSRSQFLVARPKEPAALEAGDVLFLAYPAHSTRIVHVLLYTGNDTFIEAWMERLPDNIMNVQPLHEVATRDRFGKSIHEMAQGETCGYYTCFGGTFLS